VGDQKKWKKCKKNVGKLSLNLFRRLEISLKQNDFFFEGWPIRSFKNETNEMEQSNWVFMYERKFYTEKTNSLLGLQKIGRMSKNCKIVEKTEKFHLMRNYFFLRVTNLLFKKWSKLYFLMQDQFYRFFIYERKFKIEKTNFKTGLLGGWSKKTCVSGKYIHL
jgi:hypothetical protein